MATTYRSANEYRPNRVLGKPLTQGRSAPNTGHVQYFNLSAMTLPATRNAAGQLLSPFGNLSRNPARTPAFYEKDFDLNKRFNTPVESLKVEFRAELYNLFNHTNLFLPSNPGLGGALQTFNTAGVASAGTPTSGGSVTSTFEPRIVQFALKLLY